MYQPNKRQPLTNPDGTITYYPENRSEFKVYTDIWSALSAGRTVTIGLSGAITNITDPVTGKHYDILGVEKSAPAPTEQPGGFIGPPTDVDALIAQMKSADASSELQDISIPLEDLIRDSGTITAPIYTNDPITKPENQVTIRVPTFDEKHPTVEQWLKDNPTDSVVLEMLDELTGYKDMFSGANENALMAWIAILPIGAMQEIKGLTALAKAISAKTFIKMADKAAMWQMLESALPEAAKLGKKELIESINNARGLISSGGYITQAEMQAAADKIALLIPKSAVPAVENTVIGIKGISKPEAAKSFFSKLTTSEKAKKFWGNMKDPTYLTKLYIGLTVFAFFIQEEAAQTWGFALRRLETKDPKAALAIKERSLFWNSIWGTGAIPAFGTISSFWQFFRANYDNISSYYTKQLLDDANKIDADTIKNTIPIPESIDATVLDVVDGDTIHIYFANHKYSIRLVGINSTEKGNIYKKSAGTWLENQIGGRNVTIKVDPAHQRDVYNRILGVIYIDGKSINLAEIRAGWADPDFIGDNKYVNKSEYQGAKDLAQAEKRGKWQEGTPLSTDKIGMLYKSSVITEPEAQIQLENKNYSKDTIQGLISLWQSQAAKKTKTSQPIQTMSNQNPTTPTESAPLTPLQIWQERYKTLKDLVRFQQDNILTYYKVPYQPRKLNEDGIIRLIIQLQDQYPGITSNPNTPNPNAPGTGATPTTTPNVPTGPTPSTPTAPTTKEVTIPERALTTGNIPEEAKSVREQEIWRLTKEQQAYYLKQLGWVEPKRLPLEKVLVAELNRLEMLRDFPTGMSTQPGQTTTAPVISKTSYQLSTELSKIKQDLVTDKQKLDDVTYKIKKRAPNVKPSDVLLGQYILLQTELQMRINANTAKKAELESQIAEKKKTITYVQKPVTPVTPTPVAPVTPTTPTQQPQVKVQGYQQRKATPSIEPENIESIPAPSIIPLTTGMAPDVSLIGGSQTVQPPSTPGATAPAQVLPPVTGMTYQQLKSEYTQRINSIADDQVRLQAAEALLARKIRSGGINQYDKAELERQIAELEARIEANQDRKADLQEEINVKGKPQTIPAAPAEPAAPSAPTAAPTPSQAAPPITDIDNKIRKILGATTYRYDAAHVFTDDPRVTKWTDLGYEVTVDAQGNIIDIWNRYTGNVIDENGNLLGRRDGQYENPGDENYKPIKPVTPGAPPPTIPAPTVDVKPLPPAIENYTTYTPDEAESFGANTFIGSLLRHGMQVTLDAKGNIIDIWNPETNTIFDANMNVLGERIKPYGQA